MPWKRMVCSLQLLLYAGLVTAGEPFDWLSRELVESSPVGDIEVLYNKKHSKILNRRIVEEGEEAITVLSTRIDSQSDTIYEVEYYAGPSVDPSFTIYKITAGKRKEIGGFGATRVIIPGNGHLYSSGHTNTVFDERRKYKLDGDKLVEIKQPYYYVGLKSTVRQEIKIYATQKLQNEVARLTPGAEIEVLLNDDKYYLIRTQFGLLGWYKLTDVQPAGLDHKSVIPGLYYKGD
ncbi:MAG: hypothetical protein OEZ39_15990 [Gammaproteobacteria bacterium]|nr:hypothetical protein [Gammaproteobacteria bacterium]MDH5653359.1 hypothetical protein [Gammaproteobacteria bacterium]